MNHALGLSVVCPHCLCDGFNTANVRVRTLENVFKLRKLIKAIKFEKGRNGFETPWYMSLLQSSSFSQGFGVDWLVLALRRPPHLNLHPWHYLRRCCHGL